MSLFTSHAKLHLSPLIPNLLTSQTVMKMRDTALYFDPLQIFILERGSDPQNTFLGGVCGSADEDGEFVA